MFINKIFSSKQYYAAASSIAFAIKATTHSNSVTKIAKLLYPMSSVLDIVRDE